MPIIQTGHINLIFSPSFLFVFLLSPLSFSPSFSPPLFHFFFTSSYFLHSVPSFSYPLFLFFFFIFLLLSSLSFIPPSLFPSFWINSLKWKIYLSSYIIQHSFFQERQSHSYSSGVIFVISILFNIILMFKSCQQILVTFSRLYSFCLNTQNTHLVSSPSPDFQVNFFLLQLLL